MTSKDDVKAADNNKKVSFWIPPILNKKEMPSLPEWTKHALCLFALCMIGTCFFLLINTNSNDKKVSLLVKKPFKKLWKDRVIEEAVLAKDMEPISKKNTPKKTKRTKRSHGVKTKSRVRIPVNLPTKRSINNQKIVRKVVIGQTAGNALEQIRKDPKRIYLDKKFVVDDLTFTIRNVSEKGIEIHVFNAEDSGKTYYFPKVTAVGYTSHFFGNVLSPGSNSFGWVVVPNLRKMQSLKIELTAVGAGKKSEIIKLGW